ncbi:MAG: carbamate kinase [Candidatus Eisenbacteria bacterium]|nr:carbamate kinase [Candidatus Eisenbacteria bacterium]
MDKLAVVAIGGNSLTRPGQRGTIPEQFENTRATSAVIADMIARGHEVVLTHGNGPQVGNILLRAEMASSVLPPLPLDTCGADSQGGIGYMLQQVLGTELRRRAIEKDVVTVLTQVVVDPNDPAFDEPSKPIGPFYSEEDVKRRRDEQGWAVMEDASRGWRRVVPSPMPVRIVEVGAIRALLSAGCVVIGVGGGGIPVVESDGGLRGVEAVIDKDHASRLLANQIGAGLFVISTDVPQVALHYGTDRETAIDEMTVEEAERYHREGHFPPGSMGPKVLAGIDFIRNGGGTVIITNPGSLGRALDGETGTRIIRERE